MKKNVEKVGVSLRKCVKNVKKRKWETSVKPDEYKKGCWRLVIRTPKKIYKIWKNSQEKEARRNVEWNVSQKQQHEKNINNLFISDFFRPSSTIRRWEKKKDRKSLLFILKPFSFSSLLLWPKDYTKRRALDDCEEPEFFCLWIERQNGLEEERRRILKD